MRILLAFCVAVSLCYGAELDRFFKISKAVIQDPTDAMRIRRVEDVTPEECARLCWGESGCKTFEYKAEHNKCDLSNADYENSELNIINSAYGWETFALYPDARKVVELESAAEQKASAKTLIESNVTATQNESSVAESLLEEAQAELESIRESLVDLADAKANYEEQQRSLESTIEENTARLEEIKSAVRQSQQNVGLNNDSIADAQELIESLRESLGEKDGLIAKVNQEKESLESAVNQARTSQTEKQKQISSLNDKIRELRAAIQEADEPEVIKAKDCADLYKKYGERNSGVYNIYPIGPTMNSVRVYCDMGNGGGWTVIQKRDTSKSCKYDFNRRWAEYKTGFGDPESDYYIGNDIIAILTAQPSSLRVEVSGKVSTYSLFQMGRESEGFKLKQIAYSGGNAGDQLTGLKNLKFGTLDHENNSGRCSANSGGGFWFRTTRSCSSKVFFWCRRYRTTCSQANLNARSARWASASSNIAMKIRRSNF